MYSHKIYILIFPFILLVACKLQISSPSPEVLEHVQSFYEAANSRNIILPKRKIMVEWGDMEKHQFGKCLPRKKLIILNKEAWEKMDSMRRKSLIFHELGHCLLGRKEHKDQLLARGECASLLKSETSECICNVYEKKWWKYYVDELFNEEIPLPDWYTENVQLNFLDRKNKLLLDTLFKESLVLDFDDTIHSGKFLGEVELFQTYQEDAACYFSAGPSIVPIYNNRLEIYQAKPNGTYQMHFYSGNFLGEPANKVSIYYDQLFWRFYINNHLVYKMGSDYWQEKQYWNRKYLTGFPVFLRAWGKSRISKQTIPLSGRLKIFEIQ